MAQSLFNLLSFAWADFVSGLGTTTLAKVLYAGIAVLIFLRRLYTTWRKEQTKGIAMRHILKNSLNWKDLIFYLSIWFIIFGCFVVNATYKDHQSLLKRIGELKAERDSGKRTITDKDKEIARFKERIAGLEGKLKSRTTIPAPSTLLTTPLREEGRNPDGIYQFGKLVGKVVLPYPDSMKGTVSFGQIQNAQDLNINVDFEYRDFVLHYQTSDISGTFSVMGQVTSAGYRNAVCRIVGRK